MYMNFDVADFLKKIENISWIEMIKAAESELKSLPSFDAIDFKGSRYALSEYDNFLGAFIFLLRNSVKPATIRESDFELTKPVIQKLVDKGNLKAEVLNIYNL
jgi:hypothetical protein